MAELALFLALLLAVSAGHKIVAHQRLGEAAARLAGVPQSLGPVVSNAAAAVELAAALALLFPGTRPIGALIAAVLWSGYALLLARRIGSRLDCGCSLKRSEKPITALHPARAGLLAAFAVLVAFVPATPATLLTPFAAAALLALYFAADELIAIPRPAWSEG